MILKTIIKNLVPNSLKRAYHIGLFTISSLLRGNPGKSLRIIGVTGTSGKSTTAEIIYHVLVENGINVGIVSTIGARTKCKQLATGLHVTTPDPFEIPKFLADLKENGAKYVVLECSSHALEQGRLGKLKFDYAVFTNITRDHLDWHKTWENYALAKARLIDALKPRGILVFNNDDKRGSSFLAAHAEQKRPDIQVRPYGKDPQKRIEMEPSGLVFGYKGIRIHMPIIGEYNVENATAAIKVAEELGIPLKNIVASLENFAGIPGRMQVLQHTPFLAIVDFAHNADSLEKSLDTLRKIAGNRGRIITVFGSAGLRDREKRTTMGQVSGKLADITIVTAEDPRTESLFEINSTIIKGAEEAGAKLVARFKDSADYLNYFERIDTPAEALSKSIFAFDEEAVHGRSDAINFAIQLADRGDIVVTEGKGHEESLCFGSTEYPYTDQAAVKKALEKLAKSRKIS